VAIEGGRCRIVQDGLIGDRDGEHGPEDESRLSGTEGEGDIKSQDKARIWGPLWMARRSTAGCSGWGRASSWGW
jgi:hypothetical protein